MGLSSSISAAPAGGKLFCWSSRCRERLAAGGLANLTE